MTVQYAGAVDSSSFLSSSCCDFSDIFELHQPIKDCVKHQMIEFTVPAQEPLEKWTKYSILLGSLWGGLNSCQSSLVPNVYDKP